MKRHFLRLAGLMMALAVVSPGVGMLGARPANAEDIQTWINKPRHEKRQESLQRMEDFLNAGSTSTATPAPAAPLPLAPGDKPAYGFNPVVDYALPNFAYSPNLRKFVDTLPGLGSANANNLGQYIPIAVPDTTTYPGTLGDPLDPASDYYELGVAQYQQRMHSDLPAPGTKLRGYYQLNGPDTAKQYLGPLIIAHRERPV